MCDTMTNSLPRAVLFNSATIMLARRKLQGITGTILMKQVVTITDLASILMNVILILALNTLPVITLMAATSVTVILGSTSIPSKAGVGNLESNIPDFV